MQVLAVRFQNCFSFGNEMTEVRFDKTKTSLVIGKNGGGKSSAILDTLVYALYGKPYRKLKKLSQMINSITNRDMLVEVDLVVRGKRYMVRRGQKPAVFEIWVDGQMINQASSVKEQQEWLEQNVLRMDHRAFVQIVVLGTANHVPFMQLPAAQRREVIEDILDIQIFSTMNEIHKEKLAESKAEWTAVEKELAVAQKELEVEQRHVDNSSRGKELQMEALLDNKATYEKRIEQRVDLISKCQASTIELTETIADAEDVSKKIREYDMGMASIRDKIRLAQKEIDFYRDHEDCPTCRQTITAEFREEVSKAASDRHAEFTEMLATVSQKRDTAQARMNEIYKVQEQISLNDKTFIMANTELKGAEKDLADTQRLLDNIEKEQDHGDADLIRLNALVTELGAKKDVIVKRGKLLAAAQTLLKDGGIKAKVVRQYIPKMNRLVNKYLASLELFVDFHLDEEFNEEIRSRHRDAFSYESFSEGEKLRIDLAILFAWRDIARERSSSAVDLVIFDEILDGSLDAEGADYFLKLVHEQTDDCRVFIISHREGLEDKFSRVLNFSKRNNFSKLSETG